VKHVTVKHATDSRSFLMVDLGRAPTIILYCTTSQLSVIIYTYYWRLK
jgi:hypothetical protein